MIGLETQNDIARLAMDGYPASAIKERLGLTVSLRQVQRIVVQRLGRWPKRSAATRDDPIRRRVVAWMTESGLDPRYCFQCHRISVRPPYIRQLKQDDDLGTLAFICHLCKRAGDL